MEKILSSTSQQLGNNSKVGAKYCTILLIKLCIFSPQDTLSTSSSFSQSNRSRADAPGCKNGARVNHSCVHYFGWEMGIVKLRKTLKISPRIKPEEFDRESSDFEIEIRRSVRDSGETIMEDL